MDKIIKKVLDIITNAGYEAYLVGGFVRDYLLGISSKDIDICTNALPKDLHNLFPSNNNSNNYGGFNLKIKNYNIDITTYRKEIKYEGRKPEVVYINNLEEDIKRRDFTINAVCMDKTGKIIDLVGGVNDITKRTIKMLGNIHQKLEEDPLRILRAIRFSSVLDFELDQNLVKEIKENYELVSTLSAIRIKEELTKILLNKNFLKGLTLLKDFKILDLLHISYEDVTYVNDICGMWAQLEFSSDLAFTKQELRNIINIREIVKSGVIDSHILYKYGLYNSLVASSILNIDQKQVNKLAKNLKIKNEKDLAITSEEIINTLNIKPSKIIKEIKEELIYLILDGKLPNNKKNLIEYIKRKEL